MKCHSLGVTRRKIENPKSGEKSNDPKISISKKNSRNNLHQSHSQTLKLLFRLGIQARKNVSGDILKLIGQKG